uniref:Uncharacterized protein n=1 Tax=Amphimedon queenslandica TaxID=400682 RepID=A0A1X7UFM4_AMPQE
MLTSMSTSQRKAKSFFSSVIIP